MIDLPTNCPICGCELTKKDAAYYCLNDNCAKKDIEKLIQVKNEKEMKDILKDTYLEYKNEDELNARVYQFPTSALKVHNKKINYYDFLCSDTDKDCNKALDRMLKRIDLNKINQFIDRTEYTSDIQKEFYKCYISNRYNKILISAYNTIK